MTEEQMTTGPEAQTGMQSSGRVFLYGVLCVLGIVAIAGIGIGMRATRNLSSHPAVIRLAKVLGVSVAKVNGIGVSYADYMEDLAILKKFYESQGGGLPTTQDDISDQVLSRLVIGALIDHFADAYGARVSREEVDKSPILAQVTAPFGSREAIEKEIQSRYGLTFDAYVQKVVHPVLVEQKLQEVFAVSTDEQGKTYEEDQRQARHILFSVTDPAKEKEVKKKAEEVLLRLNNGEDFAALAKEFGSDGTKDLGGDLGWFGPGRMVPEFEAAVFGGETGKLLPTLVKTQFGYHIVKVEGQRTARNYTAFMGDQIKLAKVEVLIDKVHNPFAAPQAAPEEAPPQEEPAAVEKAE